MAERKANVWTFIILITQFSGSFGGKHERALLKNIFEERGYNSMERPVQVESHILNVTFGLTLQQIIDVDEKNQLLNSNIWVNMLWTDYDLSWNTTEYGGLTDIRLPAKKIWKPDILMYNSADSNFDGTYHTNIIVSSDGSCYWVPPGMFKSTCNIDITWFPFDDQFCKLKFGSWTYSGFYINLSPTGDGDITTFIKNGEWDLIGMPVEKNTVFYDCCPNEPYYDVTFTIHIRRRSLYYYCNLIAPSIILSMLALLVFLLPPDSGEKVSLGVTIMLSLTVFLLLVAEALPQTSDAVPLIVVYFGSIMVVCSMSVIFSTIVLSFHHSSPETHQMPLWIKRGIGEWLAWLLRMTRPGKVLTKKAIMERIQMDKFEMKDISSRSLLANVTDVDEMHPNSNGGLTKMDADLSFQNQNNMSSHSCSTRSELRSILKELKFITDTAKSTDEDDEVIRDWKFAASVIDRLCLWLFLLLIVVSSLSIILSAPHVL